MSSYYLRAAPETGTLVQVSSGEGKEACGECRGRKLSQEVVSGGTSFGLTSGKLWRLTCVVNCPTLKQKADDLYSCVSQLWTETWTWRISSA